MLAYQIATPTFFIAIRTPLWRVEYCKSNPLLMLSYSAIMSCRLSSVPVFPRALFLQPKRPIKLLKKSLPNRYFIPGSKANFYILFPTLKLESHCVMALLNLPLRPHTPTYHSLSHPPSTSPDLGDKGVPNLPCTTNLPDAIFSLCTDPQFVSPTLSPAVIFSRKPSPS